MKIEILNEEERVLLINDEGESFKVSFPEFWQLCRVGHRIDVENEVNEYLNSRGEHDIICYGFSASEIKGKPNIVNRIVDQVISDRYSYENGDQIYNAIYHCLRGIKNLAI